MRKLIILHTDLLGILRNQILQISMVIMTDSGDNYILLEALLKEERERGDMMALQMLMIVLKFLQMANMLM